MKLLIEKIDSSAILPTRAHPTDAGLDLYALEEAVVASKSWQLIRTGIKIALPDQTVGLVWDKSGLAKQGLHTLAGVIDAGYRGEVIINLYNFAETDYPVKAGQKIAQLLIQNILCPELVEAVIDGQTDRGSAGFGSTGL